MTIPLLPDERRWLFMELWGPINDRQSRDEEDGTCMTCGAAQGECLDVDCIRSRVTNKLGLSSW